MKKSLSLLQTLVVMTKKGDAAMQQSIEPIHESTAGEHKDYDRLLIEAVEAGVESGRSIGVLESYNFLVREGFSAAAEVLMQLVEEEAESRKSKGDA